MISGPSRSVIDNYYLHPLGNGYPSVAVAQRCDICRCWSTQRTSASLCVRHRLRLVAEDDALPARTHSPACRHVEEEPRGPHRCQRSISHLSAAAERDSHSARSHQTQLQGRSYQKIKFRTMHFLLTINNIPLQYRRAEREESCASVLNRLFGRRIPLSVITTRSLFYDSNEIRWKSESICVPTTSDWMQTSFELATEIVGCNTNLSM